MDRILLFEMSKNISRGAAGEAFAFRIFSRELPPYQVIYLQMAGRGCPRQARWLAGLQWEMREGIRALEAQGALGERWDQGFLVYEGGFEEWLKEAGVLWWWRNLWGLPVFEEYGGVQQLQYLLRGCRDRFFDRILVLGYEPGLLPVLAGCLRRVRGLTLVLPYLPRGWEEWREQIYEEYGLMAGCVPAGEEREEQKRACRRALRERGRGPCLILDLGLTEDIPAIELPRGSLWLDLGASEKKRRCQSAREGGVEYLSLREAWLREMKETLDTIAKIQYNTKDNQGHRMRAE